MTVYQPTGTGHCKRCGRDVGAHDPGHKFRRVSWYTPSHICFHCNRDRDHLIHDVGRELRCPEVSDE